MIVVSDTSPLNYLVLIECEHVLPALFGRVLTPPAVIEELKHPRAPERVRNWANSTPSWLEVRSPSVAYSGPRLGPGESEAIGLAQELCAGIVLIDERRATLVAEQLGLVVTGTLGVLVSASQNGLIRLADAIRALPPTFRAPEAMLKALMEQASTWERERA